MRRLYFSLGKNKFWEYVLLLLNTQNVILSLVGRA